MDRLGKLRNMTGIYLLYQGKILLLYRKGSRVVNDAWVASAGGHFEQEELNDAGKCVLRELYEELGITEDMLTGLRLRYIMLRRQKGEIRQNYYFFAELKEAPPEKLSSKEGSLKWFSLDELAGLPMPFSARRMIDHYVREGRFDDCLYGGLGDGERAVFGKLPEC